MSLIQDVMRADAVAAFGDTDSGFAESITFNPRTGSPRTFPAQVFRHIPEDVFGTDRAAPVTEVWVPYSTDATKGIDTKPVLGADTVTVAERQGGTATVRQIAMVVSDDPGGWMLRLR